jgi:hypothetical protein
MQQIIVYEELERDSIVCPECASETYYDFDEPPALFATCWRCGALIGEEL